ncbi:DinB family protein [Streptomyces sp. P38-E01]|uniref:DinB family protein n=1 Tax=Streptomyces tardus TaxID=2780544 RepID=A0A949N834_9ACTN|nr:DinB family protein [Streptomyces tardus]MBU7598116.1 DinB family protein [Streptomyces tardus]
MSAIPTKPEARGDEAGALLGYLDAQRQSVRRSVHGLTDEQARSTPSASTLSLAGILKHVSQGEADWVRLMSGTDTVDYSDPEVLAQQEKSFTAEGEAESLEALLAAYEAIAAETERTVRQLPSLDETFEVPPAPWDAGGTRSWRWALLHLIEEVARHSGHADLVRETLDGRTAVDLMIANGDFTLPEEWR